MADANCALPQTGPTSPAHHLELRNALVSPKDIGIVPTWTMKKSQNALVEHIGIQSTVLKRLKGVNATLVQRESTKMKQALPVVKISEKVTQGKKLVYVRIRPLHIQVAPTVSSGQPVLWANTTMHGIETRVQIVPLALTRLRKECAHALLARLASGKIKKGESLVRTANQVRIRTNLNRSCVISAHQAGTKMRKVKAHVLPVRMERRPVLPLWSATHAKLADIRPR